MSNYLGQPISGDGGVTDHFNLTNIGVNTYVDLDAFKIDIEAKVDQDVRTLASPEFDNLTSTSLVSNSISTSTVQTSSLQSNTVLADSVNSQEIDTSQISILGNGQFKCVYRTKVLVTILSFKIQHQKPAFS